MDLAIYKRVGAGVVENVTLQDDNEIRITLTKFAESQRRTKHIDLQHHHIRELINEGELTVVRLSSFEMLADGMTKYYQRRIF